MPREDLEHGPGCVPHVDGARVGKPRADALQELVQAPRLIGQLGGPVLIVVGPAHQKRQLRAEMGRKIERDAVANPAQDGAKHMPGDLAVGADRLHQLVEPDVGCLEGFVEDVETSRAHGSLLVSHRTVDPHLPIRLTERCMCLDGSVGRRCENTRPAVSGLIYGISPIVLSVPVSVVLSVPVVVPVVVPAPTLPPLTVPPPPVLTPVVVPVPVAPPV